MDPDAIANLPDFVALLVWNAYIAYLRRHRANNSMFRQQTLRTWLAEQSERGLYPIQGILAAHVKNIWIELEEQGE